MRRAWTVTLLAYAMVLGAAPAATAAVHEVRIVAGPRFDPAEVTVAVGDTVRWVAEVSGHTVTSDADGQSPWVADGRFDASVSTTTPFEFTFEDVGTVHYYCRPHSSFMHGRVVVAQPSATQTSASTTSASSTTSSESSTGSSGPSGTRGSADDAGGAASPSGVTFLVLVVLAVALARRTRPR